MHLTKSQARALHNELPNRWLSKQMRNPNSLVVRKFNWRVKNKQYTSDGREYRHQCHIKVKF